MFNPYAKEAASIEAQTEVSFKARLPLTEDYDRFEFTVKSWTPCSKSCGGGMCVFHRISITNYTCNFEINIDSFNIDSFITEYEMLIFSIFLLIKILLTYKI